MTDDYVNRSESLFKTYCVWARCSTQSLSSLQPHDVKSFIYVMSGSFESEIWLRLRRTRLSTMGVFGIYHDSEEN
jgi:hypothetical protein